MEPDAQHQRDADDDDADSGATCTRCGEEVDLGALQCTSCGEPLDDPARGICAFCGVATSERCAGCGSLTCWECSDGARTGGSEVQAGDPWCVDCRVGAGIVHHP